MSDKIDIRFGGGCIVDGKKDPTTCRDIEMPSEFPVMDDMELRNFRSGILDHRDDIDYWPMVGPPAHIAGRLLATIWQFKAELETVKANRDFAAMLLCEVYRHTTSTHLPSGCHETIHKFLEDGPLERKPERSRR